MRCFTQILHVFSAAFTCVILSACASKGPVELKVQGEATPVVNRDSSGKSLSLVLYLYQLKNTEEFTRLTFDSLTSGRPSTELLGNSLISQSEFVMLPGKQSELPFALQTDTQFVGVVGFFRKPDGQFWRALINAEDVRKTKALSIKAEDCYLQIVAPKAQLIPGQPAVFQANCGTIPAKPIKKTK